MRHLRGAMVHRWVHLFRDSLILVASIWLAVYLVRSGVIHEFSDTLGSWSYAGIFVAGAFFSSIVTTAPAAAVLGELSQTYPPLLVAAVGALGSALADAGLLSLLRGHMAEDAKYLLSLTRRRLFKPGHTRFAHYALTLLGALCIALPFLPDEAGVVLMGLTKVSRGKFFFIAYALNFAGILAVGLTVRSLAW